MIIDLICIAVIVVFIIDLSGWTETWTGWLKKWLRLPKDRPLNLKPFTCSLCTTFWTGLIYICIQRQFTFVNCVNICILAYFTTTIKSMLVSIKGLIDILIYRFNEKIQ